MTLIATQGSNARKQHLILFFDVLSSRIEGYTNFTPL